MMLLFATVLVRQLFVFSIRCEGNIFYFGFARSISSSHTSGVCPDMKFVQFSYVVVLL